MKGLLFCALLSLSVIFQGCESKLTVQKILRKNFGREIDLSLLKQIVLPDTVLTGTVAGEVLSAKGVMVAEVVTEKAEKSKTVQEVLATIKVVVYIPSRLCTPCFRNYLLATESFTERFSSDSVQYVCIMSPRPIEQIQEAMDSLVLPQTVVIYDEEDQYLKKNSLEEYTEMFRTFLLDKDNRVVLVGDPLRSTDLQKLYTEKIRELIANGGELPKKKSLLKKR